MKLLVGYLATPGGADALALGVRLARTLGADLELCVMLPPDRVPAMVHADGYEEALVRQALGWLTDAQATVPAGVVVNPHVSFSDSFADGLIREALRLDAAAIVVGGAGGGLAGSFSLGSVVNELLHSAPVPVAVAPRGIRLSEVGQVREVTCALGDRAGADLLLETAVAASRAAGTPLRLVSLVALDPVLGALRSDPDAVREHALAHARQALDTAQEALPEGFPVTATVTDGATVEDAVNKLSWRDGDLIMVGSSRLAAPRRLFLGSTAAKILRVVEVPIVVVPRSQHRDGEAS